jgi:hypothetical protein
MDKVLWRPTIEHGFEEANIYLGNSNALLEDLKVQPTPILPPSHPTSRFSISGECVTDPAFLAKWKAADARKLEKEKARKQKRQKRKGPKKEIRIEHDDDSDDDVNSEDDEMRTIEIQKEKDDSDNDVELENAEDIAGEDQQKSEPEQTDDLPQNSQVVRKRKRDKKDLNDCEEESGGDSIPLRILPKRFRQLPERLRNENFSVLDLDNEDTGVIDSDTS